MQYAAPFIREGGWQVREILSDRGVFSTLKISQGGNPLLYKEVSPRVMPDRVAACNAQLHDEIWYYNFINDLHDLRSNVRCPRIHMTGSLGDGRDYYVSDCWETPRFPELGKDLSRLNEQEFEAAIPEIAEALYMMDAVFRKVHIAVQVVSRFTARIDRWLVENLSLGDDIPLRLIHQAREAIDSQHHLIEPLLQHGNFKPQCLFWHPSNDRPELDPHSEIWYPEPEPGEYATCIGIVSPKRVCFGRERGYDLAEMFARIYTQAGLKDAARLLRRSVCSFHHDSDSFETSFKPILTFQAVSMAVEAHRDHRESGLDYRERAKELLELTLSDETWQLA